MFLFIRHMSYRNTPWDTAMPITKTIFLIKLYSRECNLKIIHIGKEKRWKGPVTQTIFLLLIEKAIFILCRPREFMRILIRAEWSRIVTWTMSFVSHNEAVIARRRSSIQIFKPANLFKLWYIVYIWLSGMLSRFQEMSRIPYNKMLECSRKF